jgi:antitoxin component YwqK of YwqJK toxin-antitoxin module
MKQSIQYYPALPKHEDDDQIGDLSYSNPRYVSSNKLLVINYNEDNLKHGESITYWENGKPSDILTYNNGILHGSHKMFYASGKPLLDASYKDGLLEGHYKSYHPDGKIHIHRFYRNGQIDGIDIVNEKEKKETKEIK